jgi:hypothetical protein
MQEKKERREQNGEWIMKKMAKRKAQGRWELIYVRAGTTGETMVKRSRTTEMPVFLPTYPLFMLDQPLISRCTVERSLR